MKRAALFRDAAIQACAYARRLMNPKALFALAAVAVATLPGCAGPGDPLANPASYFNPNYVDGRLCMEGSGYTFFQDKGVTFTGTTWGIAYVSLNPGDVTISGIVSDNGASARVYASGGVSLPSVIGFNASPYKRVTIQNLADDADTVWVAAQRAVHVGQIKPDGSCPRLP